MDHFFKGGQAAVVGAALPHFVQKRLQALRRVVEDFNVPPPLHEDVAQSFKMVDGALLFGLYHDVLSSPDAQKNCGD